MMFPYCVVIASTRITAPKRFRQELKKFILVITSDFKNKKFEKSGKLSLVSDSIHCG